MSPRTEAELLDATIALATRTQWAVHHDRPARRAGTSWATHISGHAGFPDLVLVRRGVVLFRELKGYDKNGRMGRLSSEQRDWGRQIVPLTGPVPMDWSTVPADLRQRVRMETLFDVWTPDDWDTIIVPTLTARQPAATR